MSRGTIYVTGAAANAILAVDEVTGGIDLPDCLVGTEYTPEPVPTDVQVGRRDTLYVSTLQGGAGEILSLSKVYRVNPHTGTATEVAGGMHGATGLAVADHGNIFVAEMFAGEVSVIKRHRHTAKTVFAAASPRMSI